MPEYRVTGTVERSETTTIMANSAEHAKQIFVSIHFSRGACDVHPTKAVELPHEV